MQAYRIPGTPLDVSRIACGCMRLGGTWDATPLTATDRARAAALVEAACDEGLTLFDHADIYTRGKSEEVFGELLAQRPGLRDRIVLQSKVGIRFAGEPGADDPGRYDFSRGHLVAAVEGCLRRLRTDRLDLLLLHRPDALVEPEEVAEAVSDLARAGKVRFFGVSNHTAGQIALLQRFVEPPLVVNQVELNLWHASLIEEGLVFNTAAGASLPATGGTLDYCRRHGILVQAYSPVAKGRPWAGPSTAGRADIELIDRLAQKYQVSREAIAIGWLLRHPAGIQPIAGTRTPERLRACCQADRVRLTREEWYALLVAARGAPLP